MFESHLATPSLMDLAPCSSGGRKGETKEDLGKWKVVIQG